MAGILLHNSSQTSSARLSMNYIVSFLQNALTSISTCVPLSSSSCPANTFCMMSCSPARNSLTCSACSEPSSAGPASSKSSCPTSVLTAWASLSCEECEGERERGEGERRGGERMGKGEEGMVWQKRRQRKV